MATFQIARAGASLALTALVATGCGAGAATASPASGLATPPASQATASAAASSIASGPAATSPNPSEVEAGESWVVYQWGSPCGLDPTGTDTICLAKPDGTGRHPLPMPEAGEAKHPDWSPDGTQLTFILNDAVWVASVDGTAARKEAACTGDPCLALDYPAWSPDGLKLAYTRYDGPPLAGGPPSSSAIEIVDVATGKRSVVTQTERLELVDQARWSPDGRSLVVQVERFTEDGTETGAAIAVVDSAGGSQPRAITDFSLFATYPDWNPKGESIIFTTHDVDPTGSQVRLYSVNSDGSKLTPIDYDGSTGLRSAQPSWTPDGSRVIFVQMESRSPTIVNPDGSGLHRLDGFPATHPRLRPIP